MDLIGKTIRFEPLFQPGQWETAKVMLVDRDPSHGIILHLDNGNRRPIDQVIFDGDLDQA